MVELALSCVPVLVYVIVQARRQDTRTALDLVGWSWGPASGYGVALALLPPMLLASWLAITLIPAEALGQSGVSIAEIASARALIGVVLRAAGEEILFRGLLGGILARRLGFGWGNLAQSAIFLVPHLPLLLIDTRMWPILPVQFAAGWLLGWLRHRTGSVVPGTAVHAVANVAAALIAL